MAEKILKDIPPMNFAFEEFVDPRNNYIYVDKTKYIYELVRKRGFYYFLSRPRRFGKSLTIDTLQAVFEGRKELFKGLAIEKENYDWQTYPILRLDWTTINCESIKDLKEQIKND